ncbi:MAG: hypothetical protein JNJ83_19035 [Verrucomicrobiaceae bacterium]|nr:hypothetical protein [Verrucomicrobiaceae bacterium]
MLNDFTIPELGLWSAWLLDYPCSLIASSNLPGHDVFFETVIISLSQTIYPESYREPWGITNLKAPGPPGTCYFLESIAEGYASTEPPHSLAGIILQEWAPCMHAVLSDAFELRLTDWLDSNKRELVELEKIELRLASFWDYKTLGIERYPDLETYKALKQAIPKGGAGGTSLIKQSIAQTRVAEFLDLLPFFGQHRNKLMRGLRWSNAAT